MYDQITAALLSCLRELDRLGETIAAAHLDAAIQALGRSDAEPALPAGSPDPR